MPQLYNRVAIIGFGLIGSSIARACIGNKLAGQIVCVDTSAEVCAYVQAEKLADAATTSLAEGVSGADLVILCTPVGTFNDIVAAIAPHLALGATISDVGSVKKLVHDAFATLPDGVHKVPAHPIAGTEHSGPQAGLADLFMGKWCILTPEHESDASLRLVRFWAEMGARVEVMDAMRHDLVFATISHLPHLLAYTIVETAADLEQDTGQDVIKFLGSSFRDFTRIAASDPVMWRDIFLNNRAAVLDILDRYMEDLQEMQRAVRDGDGAALFDHFTRGRAIRRQVIDGEKA